MNNNIVNLIGEVVTEPEYSHSYLNEEFYLFYISTRRRSGIDDVLPVLISHKLLQGLALFTGMRIEVHGSFRSHNKHENGKNTLLLYIFVDAISETVKEDENQITFTGYICKPPTIRDTPLGRKISDLLVAVNRPTGKSDYIPTVTWSRNAIYVSTANVGDQITATGRVQSRAYNKRIGNDQYEERVAYEVSVSFVEIINTDRRGDSGQAPGEELLQ